MSDEGPIWLPEPAAPDPTYSPNTGPPEPLTRWLARSTVPRARALRRFLNENLALVPEQLQRSVYRRLEKQSRSAVFELVVARTLQVMGASIQVEASAPGGSRPDFRARFPEGTVIVEATSPVFDAEFGEDFARWDGLRHVIKRRAPRGWIVWIRALPPIGRDQPLGDFKRVVDRLFAGVSPAGKLAAAMELGTTSVEEAVLGGPIRMELRPRGDLSAEAEVVGPASTHWGDSESVIRAAVRRKRPQVRGSDAPVIVAVDRPPPAGESDVEDFDIALYGRTVGYVAPGIGEYASGFDPSGEWAQGLNEDRPPTIAAVLAFVGIGYTGGPDPVLYLHPRFRGQLPDGLTALRCRWYDPRANAVVERSPKTPGVLRRIAWVDPSVLKDDRDA